MYDMLNLDLKDFYFNGHYLSEFDGIVGSAEGFLNISALPDQTIHSVKPIGYDGEKFMGTVLGPRPFIIPVVFNDISIYTVRQICSWLHVTTPMPLYFKDDSVYINAIVDSSGLETFRRMAEYSVSAEIKFIAYDPFYYQVGGPTVVVTNTAAGVASLVQINNIGSEPCFPSFNVVGGAGAEYLEISLVDGDGTTVIKTLRADDILNITINMLTRTAYSSVPPAAIVNVFADITGDFWSFPSGVYYVKFLGDAAYAISTSTHFRWL